MRRELRIRLVAACLLVLLALLGVQFATADPGANDVRSTDSNYTGDTLVTVQGYGWGQDDGNAFIVTPDGEIVWKYDPPNARVFDAEVLDDGTILVSLAHPLPASDCPESQLDVRPGRCVQNRVLELDPARNNTVVWEYSWYDEFIEHHEVHDADRLANGSTAIADMGNDRAFVVDESGDVVWQWNATEHLGPGSSFRERYGGPSRTGPESDWTHMNDIDRLDNGNFQLSIRNFDVVIEVDPETNDIVGVVGRPSAGTNDDVLFDRQHNPHRIETSDTLLVADSENDRVVEIDGDGDVVWSFGGSDILQWPRDADRLPNGHTLVTDTLGNRIVEVDEDGTIVWEYVVREDGRRGFPYEADRIGVSEEPDEAPPGWRLTGRVADSSGVTAQLQRYEAELLTFLPLWIGRFELLLVGTAVLVVSVGLVDAAVLGVRRLGGE